MALILLYLATRPMVLVVCVAQSLIVRYAWVKRRLVGGRIGSESR